MFNSYGFFVYDLDSGIKILMDVIMEDTLGSAGQEKDADGYQSKTKEHKSFWYAEGSYIGIKYFSILSLSCVIERLPQTVKTN